MISAAGRNVRWPAALAVLASLVRSTEPTAAQSAKRVGDALQLAGAPRTGPAASFRMDSIVIVAKTRESINFRRAMRANPHADFAGFDLDLKVRVF